MTGKEFDNETQTKLLQEAKEFNLQHPLLSMGFENLPPIMWQIYQFFKNDIQDDDILAQMAIMDNFQERDIASSLFAVLNEKMEKFLMEHENQYIFPNHSYQEFVQETFASQLYFNYTDSYVYVGNQEVNNLSEFFNAFHEAALEVGESQDSLLENPFPNTEKLSALGYPYPKAFINFAEQALESSGMNAYSDIVEVDNDMVLDDLRLNDDADMYNLQNNAMAWIAYEVRTWLNGELKDHPKLLELEEWDDEHVTYQIIQQYTDADQFAACDNQVDTPLGSAASFTPQELLDKMADFIHEKVSEKLSMQNHYDYAPKPKL